LDSRERLISTSKPLLEHPNQAFADYRYSEANPIRASFIHREKVHLMSMENFYVVSWFATSSRLQDFCEAGRSNQALWNDGTGRSLGLGFVEMSSKEERSCHYQFT